MRLISFAGSAVQIEVEGERAAAIVEFLYRHAPADDPTPPHVTLRLCSDETGRFRLYRDGDMRYEGDSAGVAAEILLGDSCYHLADRSQGGLLFHAATLSWQGRAVMLPGTIGAGKTTLAAWLLCQGFDYLTDELVFIVHDDTAVQALARPLNFKCAGRAVWQSLLPPATDLSDLLGSTTTDLVPPEWFNPQPTLAGPPRPTPLNLIIFPRFQPNAEFNLHLLTKAQAGLELMQCLVNARNLPGHGFDDISRLARAVPAYRLTYAGFDQLAPHRADFYPP